MACPLLGTKPIVHWVLRYKLQSNLNQNTKFFFLIICVIYFPIFIGDALMALGHNANLGNPMIVLEPVKKPWRIWVKWFDTKAKTQRGSTCNHNSLDVLQRIRWWSQWELNSLMHVISEGYKNQSMVNIARGLTCWLQDEIAKIFTNVIFKIILMMKIKF